AREAGRLANWRERFWSRRYDSILVTDEDRAQVQRLKYVLSQGCKEGLVRRPQDWPGVHSVRAMLGEETLEGLWFDRSREYTARRRGQAFERPASHETSDRMPGLPCGRGGPSSERAMSRRGVKEGGRGEIRVQRHRDVVDGGVVLDRNWSMSPPVISQAMAGDHGETR